MLSSVVKIIMFALLSCAASAQAKQLVIAVDEALPPFSFLCADRQVKGADVDLLNDAARAANLSIRIVAYPWKRVLYMAENGETELAMPLFFSEERAVFANFIVPVHTSSPTLFVHQQRRAELQMLKALHGMRIGYTRGYRLPDQIVAAFKAGEIIADEVTSTQQNIQNLLRRRIDGFIASDKTTEYELGKLDPREASQIQAAISFEARQAFLVSSRAANLSQLEQPIEILKQAIIKLSQNGRLEQYAQPYLDPRNQPGCRP